MSEHTDHPSRDILNQIPLFRDLPPQELARVTDLLRIQALRPATTIMASRQPGEDAGIILTGTVKIYVEQENGSQVILAILSAGEIVGEMSLVDSLGRSASVVTLEESTLAWLDRSAFVECQRTMPILTFNLLKIFSRRVRLANVRFEALATLDVYGRVASQILALAQEYGRTAADGVVLIPLRLTQSDFAGLAGASRARVNQVLGFYKQRGYISVDRDSRITVLDAAALARRCL